MGYQFVLDYCGRCNKMFQFNPRLVPSIKNVPYCKNCVDGENVIRKALGDPNLLKYNPKGYYPGKE